MTTSGFSSEKLRATTAYEPRKEADYCREADSTLWSLVVRDFSDGTKHYQWFKVFDPARVPQIDPTALVYSAVVNSVTGEFIRNIGNPLDIVGVVPCPEPEPCTVVGKTYDIVGPASGVIVQPNDRKSISFAIIPPCGQATIDGLIYGGAVGIPSLNDYCGDGPITYDVLEGSTLRVSECGCDLSTDIVIDGVTYIEALRVTTNAPGETLDANHTDGFYVTPSGVQEAVNTANGYSATEAGTYRLYVPEGVTPNSFIAAAAGTVTGFDILADVFTAIQVNNNPNLVGTIDANDLPSNLTNFLAFNTQFNLTGDLSNNTTLTDVIVFSSPSTLTVDLGVNTTLATLRVLNTDATVTGDLSANTSLVYLDADPEDSNFTFDVGLNSTLQTLIVEGGATASTVFGNIDLNTSLVTLRRSSTEAGTTITGTVAGNSTLKNAFLFSTDVNVDGVLVSLAAGTEVNGQLRLNGTNPPPSSPTGTDAVATLLGRGWSVTVN